MLHEYGNSGSKLWVTWHREREEARQTENSDEFFSPIEIEDYDLDTARIDGSDNDDNFTAEPYGEDQESHDIREGDLF